MNKNFYKTLAQTRDNKNNCYIYIIPIDPPINRKYNEILYDDLRYKVIASKNDYNNLDLIVQNNHNDNQNENPFKIKKFFFNGHEFKLDITGSSVDNFFQWCFGRGQIKCRIGNKSYYCYLDNIVIVNKESQKHIDHMINTILPKWQYNNEKILNSISYSNFNKESKSEYVRKIIFKPYKGMIPFSLLQNESKEQSGSWSINSFIDTLYTIIDGYREQIKFFNNSAQTVIKEYQKFQKFTHNHHLKNNEINWIVKHPETLYKTKHGIIQYNNKTYDPRYIKANRNNKSLDNYENRVIISFLNSTLNKIFFLERTLNSNKNQKSDNQYYSYKTALENRIKENTIQILFELKNVKFKLESIRDIYSRIFPNVKIIAITHMPRNTKIFQELSGYKKIYDLIRNSYDKYFCLSYENLFYDITSRWNLYENYVLYNLIRSILDNGFVFSNNHNEKPEFIFNRYKTAVSKHPEQYQYTNSKFYFKKFYKGHEYGLLLTSQPYINSITYKSDNYANIMNHHEEYSKIEPMDVRFTTLFNDVLQNRVLKRISSEETNHKQYTPDYILELIDMKKRQVIKQYVFDAKYILSLNTITNKDDVESFNAFKECYSKYILDSMSSNLYHAEGFWALYGSKSESGIIKWRGNSNSGICSVNPSDEKSISILINQLLNF